MERFQKVTGRKAVRHSTWLMLCGGWQWEPLLPGQRLTGVAAPLSWLSMKTPAWSRWGGGRGLGPSPRSFCSPDMWRAPSQGARTKGAGWQPAGAIVWCCNWSNLAGRRDSGSRSVPAGWWLAAPPTAQPDCHTIGFPPARAGRPTPQNHGLGLLRTRHSVCD